MQLGIRSSINEVINDQLSSLLGFSSKNISCSNTNYSEISLLSLEDTLITKEKSKLFIRGKLNLGKLHVYYTLFLWVYKS